MLATLLQILAALLAILPWQYAEYRCPQMTSYPGIVGPSTCCPRAAAAIVSSGMAFNIFQHGQCRCYTHATACPQEFQLGGENHCSRCEMQGVGTTLQHFATVLTLWPGQNPGLRPRDVPKDFAIGGIEILCKSFLGNNNMNGKMWIKSAPSHSFHIISTQKKHEL